MFSDCAYSVNQNVSGFTPTAHIAALHHEYTGSTGAPRRGVFSIAQRVNDNSKNWREWTHPVEDARGLVSLLDLDQPDLYVSQQSFWRWRSIAHLKDLGALYVDLDYRTRSKWADSRPEHVFWSALRTLSDSGMPSPTYGLSTGRGLCLIWLHGYVPRAALPRWTASQRVLSDVLTPFGADKRATDAARVFRLVGSRNPRAVDWRDEVVRCIYAVGDPTTLRNQHAWSFGDLADEILPLRRAELVSLRVERAKRRAERDEIEKGRPATTLTTATYYEAVLTDLQRLRRYRYGEEGHLPAGERDEWLFLASSAMAHLAPPAVLAREVVALAEEAGSWNEREVRSRLGAVLRRARDAAAGAAVLDLNGNPVDPRYRWKASTILERLEIGPSEMAAAGLRVLIDSDRRRALNTERTRESRHRRGAKSREETRAERLALGKRALYLQESRGDTIEAIAAAEGVSPATVSRAMKEAREGK